MLPLTLSLILVVVSTAYGGILHMVPPMMPPPPPPQYFRGMRQFQKGPMIYPEMQHMMPMQNFHGQIGNFQHYKPFAPTRRPMWNMQQFPTFQHFKQPFHTQLHMMGQPFKFHQPGQWNGEFMGQGQLPVGGMGQGQMPVGGMGQGQWPVGGMGQGQWNGGNMGEGQWMGGDGQQNGMGQGQWDRQNYGNVDQWQNVNTQQGSFNEHESVNVPASVFPSELVKEIPGGSVTMIGDWSNRGAPGSEQGVNSQVMPNDLYNINDGFIPPNTLNNNNNGYTVGNNNPTNELNQNQVGYQGLDAKNNPVQSNQLKKKKK